jgi:phospholipid transport system substrate-binding protein
MHATRRVVLALAVAALAAPVALAGSASTFVADLGERAIAVLAQRDMGKAQRQRALAELLVTGFDMKVISRLALGRPYRDLAPAQRSDYEELFRRFVLETYGARLANYSGEQLRILRETPASDDDVVVSSEIGKAGAEPLRVDWRVRRGAGGLRIVDVVVEGVSMIVTQRNEFQAVVDARGVGGLLDLLRERVAG